MRALDVIEGRVSVLDRADVDTDQIIPAVHLRRIERTGFGPFLFGEWRKEPGFVLNDPRYAGASVLIAGPNFGSGSSREHAVWALEDAGFRALISPRFADIFRANCGKVGLVAVELPEAKVRALMGAVVDDPSTEITVDLETMRVTAPSFEAAFEMDPYTRRQLREGLDDIDLTLAHADAIEAYERTRPARLPAIGPR